MEKAVLVLENEENRASRIIDIIHDTLEYVQVYRVKDIGEAYRILVERTIDIFVVNVVVECENATDTAGMNLVARIREIPKYEQTPIILISSLEDSDMYACKELNCLGYLDRSFPMEKMKELLIKASCYQTWRSNGRTLFFRKNKVLYSVPVKDVVYMEKMPNAVVVHKNDGIMEIPYVSLKDILYVADSSSLFLCNRGTVVNKDYVYAVDVTNRLIMLRGNYKSLDIGVTHVKQVQIELLSQTDSRCLTIRKNNVYYRIPTEEFVYGESFERTLHIHMRNGMVMEVAQKPIQYIMEQENTERFLQGARGMVVNKEYIAGFDRESQSVLLQDGRLLKLGRAYAGKIKEYCKEQMGKK